LDAALAANPLAVVVANPTALHLPVAIAAAGAGCHLLVEKPLAHAMERVDELAAVVRARSLIAAVGFQFRFHPTLRVVRGWIADRAIGHVTSVRAHWGEYLPDWHPGENHLRGYSARRDLGGGVILTLSHPFDYLRWLLGEITSVAAAAARMPGLTVDVEDTAHVLVRFESGALGVVSLDYVQRPPAHTLQIVGSMGTVRWDARTGFAYLHDARTGKTTISAPPAAFERNSMFLDEMRHFLACIDGREPPECTLDDGVRALHIALAARDAAETGRWIDV
jgi:predicted dehydrogenase